MKRARFVLVLVSGLALSVAACGKDKKDKGGESGGGGQDQAAPAGDGPAVDCPGFEAKIKECTEPFLASYAKTEAAIRAGRQTADGPGDGVKGAEYYKMGITGGMMGKICTEQYANRDPRWRVRFADCMTKTDCDGWSACMGPAVGDPLK